MEYLSTELLIILLFILVLLSAFFSMAETSMMAVNHYKLLHLEKDQKHKGASRVLKLLRNTDKLLSVILIGNTIANIFASAIATLVGARLYGDQGILIATIGLTLMVLIFAEIGPKTVAARYTQPIAIATSVPIHLFSHLFYPITLLTNTLVKAFFYPFQKKSSVDKETLSTEELKSIVNFSNQGIGVHHSEMLIGVLDLQSTTVEDIMIPTAKVMGLNIEEPWDVLEQKLMTYQYTRLPIYEGHLENIRGVVHIRDVASLLIHHQLTKDILLHIAQEPHFVPETTSLQKQLINFKKSKTRMAFIVNEYGEIQGLLTLEDLLEEIVGDFTTDTAGNLQKDIIQEKDNVYKISGSMSVRDINRELKWSLPTQDSKTLNGLITEHLQSLPREEVCLKIEEYAFEILSVEKNKAKVIRAWKQVIPA
jgi:Mg2+/Co2+ transporter CorB